MNRYLVLLLLVAIVTASCSADPDDGFVYVEGGRFTMGDQTWEDSRPLSEVEVSDFYISPFEVTKTEWREFVEATNRAFPWEGFGSYVDSVDEISPSDKGPIVIVRWLDTIEYANWLSKQKGLQPVYSVDGLVPEPATGGDVPTVRFNQRANGYRLPTEAEWEYAARGGVLARPTKYAGSDNPNEVAWYRENSNGVAHPVGSKKPNELGLYDMSGNVWEHVWDYYDYQYYQSMPTEDPLGPSEGNDPELDPKRSRLVRSLRGGSFLSPVETGCVSNRASVSPTGTYATTGFRLVRSAR